MPEEPSLPRWIADADRILRDASKRATTINSATPANLSSEHARLVDSWTRGHEAAPRFEYHAPTDLSALPAALESLAAAISEDGPLGRVYADRAFELSLESRLVGAVGTPEMGPLALARYGVRDSFSVEADVLAKAWATTPRESADTVRIFSDDATDPRSLLSLVRRGVGARRLSVRVVVTKNLAPLAAVGDGVIQIAEGRLTSARDAERTALHEIEGHLVPQARALEQSTGIFSIGTRNGSDDQEGRALTVEQRAGFLVGSRRAELGCRHIAARAVLEGAHFVETMRALKVLGAETAHAVRLALRAHRGAHEGRGGLAREIVYLPAMLRVTARIQVDPWAEDVLSRGRVAVSAASALRPYITQR